MSKSLEARIERLEQRQPFEHTRPVEICIIGINADSTESDDAPIVLRVQHFASQHDESKP